MRTFSCAAVALQLSFLTGCGGGSGDGGGLPQPPPPPPPGLTAPTITTQPNGVAVIDGQDATFTVVAAGSTPLTYQWKRDGVDIPGGTSSSYGLSASLADEQARFTVEVSNAAGKALSWPATLSVTAKPPAINVQPQAQAVLAGTTATFSIVATGSAPLSFQWSRNGVPIADATSMTYTTPVLTLADTGQTYSVVTTNSAGSIASNVVSLQIDPVPNAITINVQPQSAAVSEGDVATFSVVASGTAPFHYQWRKNGVPIPGEYEPTLTIAPVTTFNQGDQYRVDITNHVGLVTSASAGLAVSPGEISLLLGNTRGWGYRDGQARLAKFGCARSVVGDGSGNYFATDALNDTVRRISAAGNVTTFVGSSRQSGSADGAGMNARFDAPAAMALDSSGNLYVVDSGNQTIRKVTPAGVVTTLAGSVGNAGAADGIGAGARFNVRNVSICVSTPDSGIVADANGNVYLADSNNHAIRKITPTGEVSTFAGALGQLGSDDGPASTARFNFPTGLAIDAAQNVYVIDRNARIRRITPAGEVSTLQSDYNVVFEGALLVDGDDGFVISSSIFRTVDRYANGSFSRIAGGTVDFGSADGRGAGASFSSPFSLAFTPARDVLVADGPALRRIDQHQGVSTFAGSLDFNSGYSDGPAASALINSPAGMAINADGDLIFADRNNNSIRKLSATGTVTTIAGVHQQLGNIDGAVVDARFKHPRGVAIDGSGAIYVSDGTSHTIRKIAAGQVSTIGGAADLSGAINGPVGTSRFNKPAGLAVDAAGNIYVADTDNHVIRKIDSAGNTSTFAGQLGISGATNGNGVAARFDGPEGLAIDGSGNLYVTELNNHAVRIITPAGDVTTFAGSLTSPGTNDGPSASARFVFLHGLTVDNSGNVYVASGSGTIRKITPAAIVTTVAGSTIEWGARVGPLPGSFSSPQYIAVVSSSGTTKLFVGTGTAVFSVTLP